MMQKYVMNTLSSAMLILAAILALPAFADEDSALSNMDILRQKLSADKKVVVTANLNLTDAEGKTFWPVYDAYQVDLNQINERMAKIVNDYSLAYNKGSVSDKTARKLLDDAIAVELAEVKLKQSYIPKLRKVLSDVKVARYIQLETKIRAILRYDLAASIPLVD